MKDWKLIKKMSDLGIKGGYARAKILSPKQRSEIARKAGIASGMARRNKNVIN